MCRLFMFQTIISVSLNIQVLGTPGLHAVMCERRLVFLFLRGNHLRKQTGMFLLAFWRIMACLIDSLNCVQIAIIFRRQVEGIGLWHSVREIARLYDACMGMFIFVPIALLSWFPFFSTFQTRLVFNQAFSRGLEISLILAGNRANTST